jgi:hypothetical protein
MNSVRFWIDPMLASKLADAKKDNNADQIVRYSAALAPTHPEVRDDLYSLVFPTIRDNGTHAYYSVRGDMAFIVTILKKYDSGYATRLWEIASDRGRDISHRYLAASRLGEVDPSNSRWPEVASNIITDHDFSTNPDLCFSEVGGPRTSTEVQAHFRGPLLTKIDHARESGCPGRLLSDLFPPKEALALAADGYLNGHFSLDSLKQNLSMTTLGTDSSDLSQWFQRESNDLEKERRRQLVISWLKVARLGEVIEFPLRVK